MANLDIAALIDGRPIGLLQARVACLCAAIVFVEGFNTQAVGYIVPDLRQSWHLSPVDLTLFIAMGLFGLLLGALFIAPLADRIGRRPVLLGCVPFLALCALLTGWSTSLPMLDAARFLTGLGIGGAMPNAISLASEYSPQRRRALLVVLIFTGFVAGSAAVGLAAGWLVPAFGWRAVFLGGGALGLLLVPFLFLALPESIRFLALQRRTRQTLRLVRQLAPDLQIDDKDLVLAEESAPGAQALPALFRDGRAKRTILLWVIYFMSLLDLFLLASWLPTEIQRLGATAGMAIIVGTLFQFGGVFGILSGWLADRIGAAAALALSYLLGALCLAAVAFAGTNVPLAMLAVFGAGVGLIGGQSLTNATAAIIYPTEIRSTGIGWATGLGRVGSIIGPAVAGYLHAMNAAAATIFLLATIPALCAAIAAANLGTLRTAVMTQAPSPA